eukprot:gene16493-biopygen11307
MVRKWGRKSTSDATSMGGFPAGTPWTGHTWIMGTGTGTVPLWCPVAGGPFILLVPLPAPARRGAPALRASAGAGHAGAESRRGAPIASSQFNCGRLVPCSRRRAPPLTSYARLPPPPHWKTHFWGERANAKGLA